MFRWAFILWSGFSLVFGTILLLAYIWMAPWILVLFVGAFWLLGRSLRKNYRLVVGRNSLADGPQSPVKGSSRSDRRGALLRCEGCGFTGPERAFHGMDEWSCPRCQLDESAIQSPGSLDDPNICS